MPVRGDLREWGEQLYRCCPEWPTDELGNVLANSLEDATGWCRQVASWTQEVIGNGGFGPVASDRMNWSIRNLQKAQPPRKAYDRLVRLLLTGYDLLGKKAPREAKAGEYRVVDEREPLPACSVAEHAGVAKSIVRRRFPAPLKLWVPGMFREDFRAETDPFASQMRKTLRHLEDARKWLLLKLARFLKKGVSPAEIRKFQAPVLATQRRQATTWQKSYWSLEKFLYSGETMQAAPWVWLGANLLGYGVPPRYNVFQHIPKRIQQFVRVEITFAGIGPVPEFLSTVAGALKLAVGNLGSHHAAESPSGAKQVPADAITAAVAIRDYHVSRATLYRERRDGTLHGYRPPNAKSNSPYLYSREELERRWGKQRSSQR